VNDFEFNNRLNKGMLEFTSSETAHTVNPW